MEMWIARDSFGIPEDGFLHCFPNMPVRSGDTWVPEDRKWHGIAMLPTAWFPELTHACEPKRIRIATITELE